MTVKMSASVRVVKVSEHSIRAAIRAAKRGGNRRRAWAEPRGPVGTAPGRGPTGLDVLRACERLVTEGEAAAGPVGIGHGVHRRHAEGRAKAVELARRVRQVGPLGPEGRPGGIGFHGGHGKACRADTLRQGVRPPTGGQEADCGEIEARNGSRP